jgi:hypothetical protein
MIAPGLFVHPLRRRIEPYHRVKPRYLRYRFLVRPGRSASGSSPTAFISGVVVKGISVACCPSPYCVPQLVSYFRLPYLVGGAYPGSPAVVCLRGKGMAAWHPCRLKGDTVPGIDGFVLDQSQVFAPYISRYIERGTNAGGIPGQGNLNSVAPSRLNTPERRACGCQDLCL